MEEELRAGAVRVRSGGEGVLAGVMEARRRGVRVSVEDIQEGQGGPMRRKWCCMAGGSFQDVTTAAEAW